MGFLQNNKHAAIVMMCVVFMISLFFMGGGIREQNGGESSFSSSSQPGLNEAEKTPLGRSMMRKNQFKKKKASPGQSNPEKQEKTGLLKQSPRLSLDEAQMEKRAARMRAGIVKRVQDLSKNHDWDEKRTEEVTHFFLDGLKAHQEIREKVAAGKLDRSAAMGARRKSLETRKKVLEDLLGKDLAVEVLSEMESKERRKSEK